MNRAYPPLAHGGGWAAIPNRASQQPYFLRSTQ